MKLLTKSIKTTTIAIAMLATTESLSENGGSFNSESHPTLTIEDISAYGSGCSDSDVSSLGSDRISNHFDDLLAAAGYKISIADGLRNCILVVDLEYPQGWTFALKKIDYEGFLNLADKAEAEISVNLWLFG